MITIKIGYISNDSTYSTPWTPVQIIKQSPAKITACGMHDTEQKFPRVYTLRTCGSFIESGKDVFRPKTLVASDAACAACVAANEKYTAAKELRHRKNNVVGALAKAVAGQKNGCGDYCLDDAQLAAYEKALLIITEANAVNAAESAAKWAAYDTQRDAR